MAVFRVPKKQDFTIMSNHHLRNTALSLKAKGLLSLMLSLPPNWDYTTKGLAAICKDGVDSISGALKELEQHGYLTRERIRGENGQLRDVVYTIHEQPRNPITKPSSPKLENPEQVNPILEKPVLGNPAQLRTNGIKDLFELNTHQSIGGFDDSMDEIETYRELIMENIEYPILFAQHGSRLDEIVELVLETVCSSADSLKIAGKLIPAEIVKSRLLKLDSSHVQYVLDCMDENTTKVRNIKAYLLTALFNAPATMESYYQAEVNHDFGGNRNE